LAHDKYLKLRGGFPEPYKTLFVCGYHLGTRSGELRKIQWPRVDFDRKEIVIQRYTTKNKNPRVLPIYGDMMEFLKMAKETRDLQYPNCPWVFQRKGRKMHFDNDLWNKRVEKLGSPGLLFHDLRRTAATNLIEAGFSEKEAMEITGHKTDHMFRRYHIIRRHRIQTIGQRMEEYFQNLEKPSETPVPGIVTGHSEGKDKVN
jgi:integrase